MRHSRLAACALLALLALASPVAAAPEGQMTWGVHISLAPTWFDPAETQGIITPFMVMYALHDALVKPMPGNPMAPSLAESWTVSPDGLRLRLRAAQGREVPQRRPGHRRGREVLVRALPRRRAPRPLKDRVAAVETPGPLQVRFRLKKPWPDFMTFYTAASGAGWIVPKKYVEKVGDDGFKKAPIGAGPVQVRLVHARASSWSWRPSTGYWRKTPSVKRLVFKVDPGRVDAAGRAQARRGRHRLLDPRRARRGAAAHARAHAEADGHPGAAVGQHARPVGPEVALARPARAPGRQPRDRPQGDQPGDHARPLAADLQHHPEHASTSTGSRPPTRSTRRRPRSSWPRPAIPNGFDAGDYYLRHRRTPTCRRPIANYLQQVGIRTKLRPLRARGALVSSYTDKKYKNLAYTASGAFGNAATRLEAFVVTGGAYVYGSYPDIDSLFKDQAAELDRKKREALLHRIQQLMHEKVMYIPIWELAFINGQGPRVQESGLGLIPGHAYSAPYEDVKLKAK